MVFGPITSWQIDGETMETVTDFILGGSKITAGEQWQPTLILLPGKSHRWRSRVGCSPWGREESDTTEQLPFHFSLSCIGERNGNPPRYSCLENPTDRGAWWAAIYGVTQSQTRLKRLSSSSTHRPLSFDTDIYLTNSPGAV